MRDRGVLVCKRRPWTDLESLLSGVFRHIRGRGGVPKLNLRWRVHVRAWVLLRRGRHDSCGHRVRPRDLLHRRSGAGRCLYGAGGALLRFSILVSERCGLSGRVLLRRRHRECDGVRERGLLVPLWFRKRDCGCLHRGVVGFCAGRCRVQCGDLWRRVHGGRGLSLPRREHFRCWHRVPSGQLLHRWLRCRYLLQRRRRGEVLPRSDVFKHRRVVPCRIFVFRWDAGRCSVRGRGVLVHKWRVCTH